MAGCMARGGGDPCTHAPRGGEVSILFLQIFRFWDFWLSGDLGKNEKSL